MADVGSARKRREMNGTAEHHSPVKKLKLEDDEPPEANPNALEAVRHKNKELALDLLEKNRRIAFLAHKCESLYRQRTVSQRAFRCIQRQWLHLVNDVSSASDVLGVETAGDEWRDVVAKTESLGVLRLPSEAVTIALPEWFLAISRSEKEIELKEADDDDDGDGHETSSELLNEKENQVQKALQSEHQRVSDVLQKVFAAVASASAKPLEFKELIDQKRLATAHVLELKDDVATMKQKLADMQSDLEAKEVERHRACRAYDRLKEFVEKQGNAATAESANGLKVENGNSRAEQDGNENDAKVAPPKSGEKRVTLVDPEVKPSMDRALVHKLNEDIKILLQKLKEERQHVESMRTEQNRLRAVETAAKQEEARLKQEFDATVSRLQEGKDLLSDELAVARLEGVDQQRLIEEKWKAHLDKIQEDATKTKAKFNELVFKNTAMRDKLSSFTVYRDQLSDLKSQHESLKREAERLKQDLQREKSRGQREEKVEESKQVVELRGRLTLVETERDELKARVAQLTSSLEKSGDTQLAEALRRESEALQKCEQLRADNTSISTEVEKARAELEMANSNHDAFKDENDALVGEIEALGKEIEASRHSKKKVLKQLEEKRQSVKKMQSELAKESDARLHATEELATVRLQVSSLKYVHSQQKAALEAAKEVQKASEHELAELKRTLAIVQNERDALATEKVKADREADVARQVLKAESTHKQRQVLQDKSRPCDKCETYRKKEADYEKRIATLRAAAGNNSAGSSSETSGGLGELERFELQDLRKQLKCSVCQDRHKNVIISKCSHLFCKECVDSNLRSRNRKCPTCKKMFGQDDVKSVWFT